MSKASLYWIPAVLTVVVLLVGAAYQRDMNRALERVRGHSTVIPSPFGDIEYSEGGVGTPVLVIHGSGGGYDQGELIAQSFLDNSRFRWIAPSRFGYLRSTFRDGATFDDQADAYATLLDHLGIEKVAVLAISHGGPSALLFALRHPERVSSLSLISAGVASSTMDSQAQANQKGSALTTIYKYDWLYWGITKAFKKQFMELMGASEAVIAGLTPAQRDTMERVIEEMNPASLRTAGVAFDNGAPMPNARIAGIQAPTLILHAVDDSLQVYHNAEFAAATIPGAELVRFEHGGHFVMVVEQPTIRATVQKQILDNAGIPPTPANGGQTS